MTMAITSSETVRGFLDLFAGRTDAIGLDRGGVEKRPVCWEDHEDHLDGVTAIGVFPMLDGNAVHFAAIDLDEPDFALASVLQRFIPGTSFVERSRSGNAHIWVFFREPCPAWAARGVLRHATQALGRPEVEVFPKQDTLRPGMVGNYINLPWFGETRPILDAWGAPMDRDAWIDQALDTRHDPETWVKRARALGATPPQERQESSEFGEQPILHECALHILENGRRGNPVAKGHRHQVAFRLACMLLNYREFTRQEAWDTLASFNKDGGFQPELGENELWSLFTNAQRGRYTSTGCDDPLMAPYVRADCPIARGETGR
jgi:hypothetical protein